MKALVRKLLQKTGYDIVRARPTDADALKSIDDLAAEDLRILRDCRPFTMTSPARMASLLYAVQYLVDNRIPGDIAECGVWRGGSMMIVARALLAAGDTGRALYLYDTFEGMSEPTDDDAHRGESARDQLDRTPEGTGVWCYAGLEDVKRNLLSTGYPEENIHFVKGKVEDTIPGTIPGPLALLRLDTDWYESTRHELRHLYPLLGEDSILIIDDYGYWEGARKAVDEYFRDFPKPPYLQRIDSTGRIVVNPPRRGGSNQ
jgi:hypothetical protein